MNRADVLDLATWVWLGLTAAAILLTSVILAVRRRRRSSAGAATRLQSAVLHTWPVAAGLFSHPQGRTLMTNAQWKELQGEPNLDLEVTALVHDAEAVPGGLPIPRELDRFVLHASWLPDLHAALIFAVGRESGARSALVLAELVHIAAKEWRSLSEIVHDIAAHTARSAFVHDRLSMTAANGAATVLDKILGPASDLLPGRLGDWTSMSVEDLAQKAADSATVQGLEVEPVIDRADTALCVRVRPDAIHHIFRNLGQNAVFHNRSTAAWAVVETTEPAHTAPRRVFIHFIDNGVVGFDPVARSAVTKHQPVGTDRMQVERLGLGYGLYLCHAFAEQNYGDLELIDSHTRERLATRLPPDAFGEKSVGFTLALPASPAAPSVR